MFNVTTTELPKRYHDAVERWRQMYLPDYDYLLDNWERFFPRDPKFRLCAYREMGMPCSIEVGHDLTTTNWVVLEDEVPGTGGIVAVTDPAATNWNAGFYRVGLQP